MPSFLPPSSGRTRNLPWEMLEHIYSYCDTPTLVALSRVSFGSWEMATPFLYEVIEIHTLDQLKSLFFLDRSPTARLEPATPALTRVKSLKIEVLHWDQNHAPFFDQPEEVIDEEEEEVVGLDLSDVALLDPHRIQRATSRDRPALPVRSLTIADDFSVRGLIPFFCLQLFPFLNPTTVVHVNPAYGPSFGGEWWASTSKRLNPDYLSCWTDLECVIAKSNCFTCVIPEEEFDEIPLYSLWIPPTDAGETRRLKLVLDYASQFNKYTDAFRSSARSGCHADLFQLGATEEHVAFQTAVMIVKKEDEAMVTKEVAEYLPWMRDMVAIETA